MSLDPITVSLDDGRPVTLTPDVPRRPRPGQAYVRCILFDSAVRWVWLAIGWEEWAPAWLAHAVEQQLTQCLTSASATSPERPHAM